MNEKVLASVRAYFAKARLIALQNKVFHAPNSGIEQYWRGRVEATEAMIEHLDRVIIPVPWYRRFKQLFEFRSRA